MDIQIHTIQFYLEPGTPSIALRDVPRPEWRFGETAQHHQCPVAYSIRLAQNTPLFISLRLSGPAGRSFRIRARVPEEELGFGCLFFWLQWVIPVREWHRLNVLGPIDEFEVTFPPAPDRQQPTDKHVRTETVAVVQLRNHLVGHRGVGASNCTLRWEQFVESPSSGGGWQEIIPTKHRVFCLYNQPTLPWSQDVANNEKLPWVGALEYVCGFVSGLRTPEQILANIIQEIWTAGLHGHLRYDSTVPGAFTNIHPGDVFHLREFLSHMSAPSRSRSVQCFDTAAALAILVNLIGIETSTRVMTSSERTPGEPRRPYLQLLGRTDRNFELAWVEHVCVAYSGLLWDACLRFNYGDGITPDVRAVYGFQPAEYKTRLGGSFAADYIRIESGPLNDFD